MSEQKNNDEVVFDRLMDVATGKPVRIKIVDALKGISTKRLRDKYSQREKWANGAQ